MELIKVADEDIVWNIVGVSRVTQSVFFYSERASFSDKRLWYQLEFFDHNPILQKTTSVAVVQTQNSHRSTRLRSDGTEIGILTVSVRLAKIVFYSLEISTGKVRTYGALNVPHLVEGPQSCDLLYSDVVQWVLVNPYEGYQFSQILVTEPDVKRKTSKNTASVGKVDLKLFLKLSEIEISEESSHEYTVIGTEQVREDLYIFCTIKNSSNSQQQNILLMFDVSSLEVDSKNNKPSAPLIKRFVYSPDLEEVEAVPHIKSYYKKTFIANNNLYFASISLHCVTLSNRSCFLHVFKLDLESDSSATKTKSFCWKFMKKIHLDFPQKILVSAPLLKACCDGTNLFAKLAVSVKADQKSDTTCEKRVKPSSDMLLCLVIYPWTLQDLCVKELALAFPTLSTLSKQALVDEMGISKRLVEKYFAFNATEAPLGVGDLVSCSISSVPNQETRRKSSARRLLDLVKFKRN